MFMRILSIAVALVCSGFSFAVAAESQGGITACENSQYHHEKDNALRCAKAFLRAEELLSDSKTAEVVKMAELCDKATPLFSSGEYYSNHACQVGFFEAIHARVSFQGTDILRAVDACGPYLNKYNDAYGSDSGSFSACLNGYLTSASLEGGIAAVCGTYHYVFKKKACLLGADKAYAQAQAAQAKNADASSDAGAKK
jgi:hypothetical protein